MKKQQQAELNQRFDLMTDKQRAMALDWFREMTDGLTVPASAPRSNVVRMRIENVRPAAR